MLSSTTLEKEPYFVFREAKTTNDFNRLLRMRYRVFRNSNLAKLIQENDYGIDIDCYDLRARHFGLFRVENNTEGTAGYLRVVEDRLVPIEYPIISLIERMPELCDKLKQEPKYLFPTMNYLPNPSIIRNLYENISHVGKQMMEPCRFALDEPFRSLRLAKHMVESILAVYGSFLGIEHAIYSCDASNASFYKTYGFNRLKEIPESDFVGIGANSCCLFASYSKIPLPIRNRIEIMAKYFAETGEIYFIPSQSNRYYNPKSITDG